jgi:hypothetical protein
MYKYTLYLLLFLYPTHIFTQSVENVRFEQQGDQIIILYDLNADGLKGNFSVDAYYTLDQGKNYIILKSVTGDAGTGIIAGKRKRIVWNVLDDVYELTGEIKFKVVASPQKRYTFWDYDLFFSARSVKDYWPFGGRIGLLGPGRIGGYGSFVYGVSYLLECDKFVVAGGPIVKLARTEKISLSLFAGGGYYDEYYSAEFYDWSDTYGFLGEGGFILNLSHINITAGLELSDTIYAFGGIGFTL